MRSVIAIFIGTVLVLSAVQQSRAQINERVVDIATRPGVTQRLLFLAPQNPSAAVILFAGGHDGLRILANGRLSWGSGNFLVRSRKVFAENGLMVAVVDAPSDRQVPPYLAGYRQKPEHVADVKAIIAWLKRQADIPVWLVGTSRGTQSAAFVATQHIREEGPDGLILTSTILTDPKGRPVPDMALGRLKIPVLVIHHEQDGCKLCAIVDMPRLMKKLTATPRKELITFKGGENKGDPCEAFAYHGFNGLEQQVIRRITEWIAAK